MANTIKLEKWINEHCEDAELRQWMLAIISERNELRSENVKLRKQCVLCVMSCDGTSEDDLKPAPLVARTIDKLLKQIRELKFKVANK